MYEWSNVFKQPQSPRHLEHRSGHQSPFASNRKFQQPFLHLLLHGDTTIAIITIAITVTIAVSSARSIQSIPSRSFPFIFGEITGPRFNGRPSYRVDGDLRTL